MFNVPISISLFPVLTSVFQVDQYQNVSILNFIGSKDDVGGDDNWSYNVCKATSQINNTNQHPAFLQAGGCRVSEH